MWDVVIILQNDFCSLSVNIYSAWHIYFERTAPPVSILCNSKGTSLF
jgi:hypothetical protein